MRLECDRCHTAWEPGQFIFSVPIGILYHLGYEGVRKYAHYILGDEIAIEREIEHAIADACNGSVSWTQPKETTT